MAKIKFRKPNNYDMAVAQKGVPFTYRDADGHTYGTFKISMFNTDSKFVRVKLDQFSRDNKAALDAIKDDAERGVYIFINTCLHGWEGVEDQDGKAVPFTPENAADLLYDANEDDETMFNDLVRFSQNMANFKHDPRASKEADAKN